MLVDTDVLVWYFRGNARAIERLNQIPDLAISAITYLELLQGVFRSPIAGLLARNATQLDKPKPAAPHIAWSYAEHP